MSELEARVTALETKVAAIESKYVKTYKLSAIGATGDWIKIAQGTFNIGSSGNGIAFVVGGSTVFSNASIAIQTVSFTSRSTNRVIKVVNIGGIAGTTYGTTVDNGIVTIWMRRPAYTHDVWFTVVQQSGFVIEGVFGTGSTTTEPTDIVYGTQGYVDSAVWN